MWLGQVQTDTPFLVHLWDMHAQCHPWDIHAQSQSNEMHQIGVQIDFLPIFDGQKHKNPILVFQFEVLGLLQSLQLCRHGEWSSRLGPVGKQGGIFCGWPLTWHSSLKIQLPAVSPCRWKCTRTSQMNCWCVKVWRK